MFKYLVLSALLFESIKGFSSLTLYSDNHCGTSSYTLSNGCYTTPYSIFATDGSGVDGGEAFSILFNTDSFHILGWTGTSCASPNINVGNFGFKQAIGTCLQYGWGYDGDIGSSLQAA